MKIGILTFHNAHNYGAMLQCYALQQYLLKCGHDVEVIDYRPYFYQKQYERHTLSKCFRKNIFLFLKNIYYNYILYNLRYFAFDRFLQQYIYVSKESMCIPDYYDAYIVGSDQIWNPSITDGFQDIYFCNFNFSKGKRKYISYAPSLEIRHLTLEEKVYLKRALSKFDAISVREKFSIPLLQPLTNKVITQVCDPILLGDISLWDPMIRIRHIKYRYVLVYQIRETSDAMVLARRIANQISGKIVVLTARIDKKYDTKYQIASPSEFINYIYYADFVVTTSFHGCAFSILFNKSFYSFELGDEFDLRTTSLLQTVGLEHRMIDGIDNISISNINFDEVNSKLDKLKQESRLFLKEALDIQNLDSLD